jgi:hypothetical protein
MSVREKDNPALYTRIQEQNLLRQYDLLSNCVEIALEKGIEAFEIHIVGLKLCGRGEHCPIWRSVPRGPDSSRQSYSPALQRCAESYGSILFSYPRELDNR